VHIDSITKEHSPTTTSMGNETNVLAIGLACRTQTKFSCTLSHIVFGHSTNWEHHVFQLRSLQHVQDVTLIFGKVRTASQTRSAIGRSHNLRVMTGSDNVETQCLGPGHKPIKLEVPVAFDARVGSNSSGMISDIGFDNVAIKVLGEVEHQMIDLELLCHSASVINVAY